MIINLGKSGLIFEKNMHGFQYFSFAHLPNFIDNGFEFFQAMGCLRPHGFNITVAKSIRSILLNIILFFSSPLTANIEHSLSPQVANG